MSQRVLSIAKPKTTRQRFRDVLAVVAIAAVLPGTARSQSIVRVEQKDDGIAIHASVPLHADIETAWRVLTGYDEYERFEPDLRWSHVTARNGHRVSVEQRGDVALWRLRIPLEVTYDITELPPNRVLSRATGNCSCTLESSYALEPSVTGVRLDYAGRLLAGAGVFGWIERAAGERFLERHLRALTGEIERQSADRSR